MSLPALYSPALASGASAALRLRRHAFACALGMAGAALLPCAAAVWGQATTSAPSMAASAPATAPATLPAVTAAPATEPLIPATKPATPAAAASVPAGGGGAGTGGGTAEVPAVTQAFVGTITSDRVYVRSGAGTAYYEIGLLGKGDLVYVVGASKGWYQILPPNGTYCMVAKEFVDADADGTTGTVKGDYVNVRAATAMNKNRDPSVVVKVVRKGAKLRIIGTTDKYYEIAPPEGAFVYVSPQFVKAAPGTEYRVPQLKLTAGAVGPTVVTVEAPTVPPVATGGGATIVIPPEPGVAATGGGTVTPAGGMAGGGGGGEETAQSQPQPQRLPPLVPKATFSETATAQVRDANARYQEEAKKPPTEQNVEGFVKDFKDILAMENVSPSVKAGANADITAVERTMAVQKLVKEQANADEMTRKQSDALREEYESAEKALAAARVEGPYSAEGILQTSTIVQGKYALVNPQTGRVVAYVDPSAASVDIGSLVGKYIGVRGITRKMEGTDMTLIQVSNATLMPQPK